jgi:hypothetical protein
MAVGFASAIFARGANFSNASFSSDASFHQTQFGQKTEHSIGSGYVYFNGTVFGKESRVSFERTWSRRWSGRLSWMRRGGALSCALMPGAEA